MLASAIRTDLLRAIPALRPSPRSPAGATIGPGDRAYGRAWVVRRRRDDAPGPRRAPARRPHRGPRATRSGSTTRRALGWPGGPCPRPLGPPCRVACGILTRARPSPTDPGGSRMMARAEDQPCALDLGRQGASLDHW